MINCLFVGAGGFIGAVLRYLLGLLPVSERTQFPVVTMGINILGAFAIGCISAAAARFGWDSRAVLLLKTGVCGGFTTFSTFSLESVQLLSGGRTEMAAAYMAGSLALCLAAVFAGKWLIQAI